MKTIFYILIAVGCLAVGLYAYFYFSEMSPEISCEKLGGKIDRGNPGHKPLCSFPTSDGGKECTDSSQCESRRCYAPFPRDLNVSQNITGICGSWTLDFGCMDVVTNGKIDPTCFD